MKKAKSTKKVAAKRGRLYVHSKAGSRKGAKGLSRAYDLRFRATPDYVAALPDVVHAPEEIQGSRVPIQQVGVSNFRLPLRYRTATGRTVVLETRVTGTVSLEAEHKGINMGRIVRSFYEGRGAVFSLERLGRVLAGYRRDVGSLSARLRLAFEYPMVQHALRSGLSGFQYYTVVLEGRLDANGVFHRFMEFDFVYSSACPCSSELAEHARSERGVFAVPHSQRSRAHVRVELAKGARLSVEDMQLHCLRALRTETQVMVKREDEQAFAELNGAELKFVEDAARLLHRELDADTRIADFQAVCVHFESLHSHDAVSVICKGVEGGLNAEFNDFRGLLC